MSRQQSWKGRFLLRENQGVYSTKHSEIQLATSSDPQCSRLTHSAQLANGVLVASVSMRPLILTVLLLALRQGLLDPTQPRSGRPAPSRRS
jgi:hypothetical protein